MAIEVIGKDSDVKRYREYLHSQGKHTKFYMDELSKRTGQPIVEKPEGYRVISGNIAVRTKLVDGKVNENPEYKEDEKLLIRGVANANIVDRMDERLDPSGIDVLNFMKNRVLLSDHMYMNQAVIGRVEALTVEEDGVHFDAYIGDPKKAPLTNLQKDIRSLVAQKLIQTVSVGFIPHRIRAPEWDDEGRMTSPAVIEKWELLELSVVAVPANPGATFDMRSSIALNDNKGIDGALLTSHNKTEDNQTTIQKDNVDHSNKDNNEEGYKMDEKMANDMIESVKTMVTLLGSLSSTMERSITLNETILSHIEAKKESAPAPAAETPAKEDEKAKKPKEDEEEDDEMEGKAFDAKGAIESIQKQINDLAEIVKMLIDRE